MELRVLFFASLREALGCAEECVTVPDEIRTMEALRAHLVLRGGVWQALAAERIQMARNQDLADMHTLIQSGDEVAFFPPVTGG